MICINPNDKEFQKRNLDSNPLLAEVKYKEQVKSVSQAIQEPLTDLGEGIEWLQRVMPDAPLQIVEGLVDNVAKGSFDTLNDLITVSRDYADKKTVYHEAFHRAFSLLPLPQQEELLNEGSKKFGIERGESTAERKYQKVDFVLKAVDILNSDKAAQVFEKGKKNNWDLNKILTELAIPKDQKQIILDLKSTTREEIVLELVSNYSYAIEINTTKDKQVLTKIGENLANIYIFESNGYMFAKINDYYAKYKIVDKDTEGAQYDKEKNVYYLLSENDSITTKEYNEALEQSTTISIPTQHYSNLTVPGGANYTEQEISTPLITPSIRGHAEFATDKGIGWFRSDELSQNNVSTKTRRILEVQSDLFQKGRDKKDLIGGTTGKLNAQMQDGYRIDNYLYFIDEGGEYVKNNLSDDNMETKFQEISKEEFEKNIPDTKISSEENKFLQLLNKDSNWVTFFVKSVIQDSVKNGYEKVLFPTGNTASKVEGHTTLEEFRKQKEDRIKELENEKQIILNGKNKRFNDVWFDSNNLIVGDIKVSKETFNQKLDDVVNTEINQLKQELENIERDGIATLKPIWNFYENVVANVLRKQGLQPKLITDEYGNTWQEIDLDSTKELVKNIRLQSEQFEYTGDLAIEEKMAEYSETKLGEPKNRFERLLKKILDFIKSLGKKNSKLDDLVSRINKGKIQARLIQEKVYENLITTPSLILEDKAVDLCAYKSISVDNTIPF